MTEPQSPDELSEDHVLGYHNTGPQPGCPECDDRIAEAHDRSQDRSYDPRYL